jgi:hypothetical protein
MDCGSTSCLEARNSNKISVGKMKRPLGKPRHGVRIILK